MKKLNKISFVVSILMIVSILISTISFAATKTEVTMEVDKKEDIVIDLDGQGRVRKSLKSYDLEKKEVTISLEVENLMKKGQDIKPSEIYLVLDNSNSMTEQNVGNTGKTRRDLIFDAAKVLIQKLLEGNAETKIGIVKFSSKDGQEGTLADGELLLQATNNKQTIDATIDGIQEYGMRTNIDAGLQIALNNITTDTSKNRYIILLSDGLPNNSVGEGTGNGTSMMYSGKTIENTRATLTKIKNQGINLVTVFSGVNELTTIGDGSGKTQGELVVELFGSKTNPDFGTYYMAQDSEATKTITEDVYKDVIIYYENALKDIVITDVFPQEIIDNFDFKITKAANIGNVTAEVDKNTNSITWTIEKLDPGEKGYLEYTLSLKDTVDDKILNLDLPTNKELDVKYKDKDEQDKNKKSEDTPGIIRLKKPEPKPVPKDNTVAPTPIPQTGENAIIALIICLPILISMAYLVYKKRNEFIEEKYIKK